MNLLVSMYSFFLILHPATLSMNRNICSDNSFIKHRYSINSFPQFCLQWCSYYIETLCWLVINWYIRVASQFAKQFKTWDFRKLGNIRKILKRHYCLVPSPSPKMKSTLVLLSRRFPTRPKIPEQKFKYLQDEKSFISEIIFHHFFITWLLFAGNCLRTERALKVRNLNVWKIFFINKNQILLH